MAKITYSDKTIGSKWKAVDANEVKTSVNDLYDEIDAGTNVIKNQSEEIQDASFSIRNSGHIGGYGVEETFVSPTITGHQGYATDGTYHYIFDTARIDKRNNDGSWSVALSNTTPFTGIAGVNHIGDGDYSSGLLYLPIESFTVPATFSNQKICTFNPETLLLVNQFDVSAQEHEVSGVAIDAVNNLAYVSSYLDGTKLWIYNAATFSFIGTLSLSKTIRQIQGIDYENGLIYISSESEGIFTCDESTGEITFLQESISGNYISEGIAVVSGVVRLLVDNNGSGNNSNVHYYTPNATPQGFYTDNDGTSYFGNSLRVGNVLQAKSTDTIGVLNIGNNKANHIYLSSLNNVKATLGHDDLTTFLTRNAYYDGNWQRPNSAKNSLALLINEPGNRFEFRSSLAASGTITWLTPVFVNASGKIVTTNATETIFDGTGVSADERVFLIKNTTANAATAFVASDNTGSRLCSYGVVNSTSTLGASYGLAGEGFIRSNGGATGFNLSVANGPLRFTVNNGTEAIRIFQTTRNIAIGTTTDIASAKLIVTSTTQGFLPPRMTTTERNAIASPVAGLMIYNTTTNKLNVFTTVWEAVTSA